MGVHRILLTCSVWLLGLRLLFALSCAVCFVLKVVGVATASAVVELHTLLPFHVVEPPAHVVAALTGYRCQTANVLFCKGK